ncbi:Biotin-protein ligase domain-containing protein [Rozella allomycis CSF55]|uniref:Biotin-protein ligase domain-containing protein n=1 Tax=Rozella allomycis (strain CSF55) TaxID=988480 RepID=A0A075B534_ROZAC|nr:Biotin-protein ligase domain-containing protein [Rozella allomycis CSF55]|eukprot:EPZ36878.1 Biotin-protein ligase domain-containing protein [Rozella allomycis CSF55]
MNVLVYDDLGVSTNSLKHTLYSLKLYLNKKYDVHTVNAKQLCNEPWQDNCACLVIPGGEDKFYQSKLHPVATEKIRNYIFQGGKYFGICAGGYFASGQIEFERDTSNSVIGERNLKFFKGKAIGCLNEGFEYKKESGMMQVLVSSPLGHHFYAYYNGGCYFSPWQDVDVDSFEIISEYQINLMSGIKSELNKFKTLPAAICCKYGMGRALLVGFHPEYDPEIEWEDNLFDNTKIVKTRKESNEFFIFLLDKLNLSANLATEITYLQKNMTIYVYVMKKYSREEIKALPAQVDSSDVIFVKDMKKTTDFDGLAVFIKWPNDIYAKKDGKLLKIGGIIVNSTFDGDLFTLVVGNLIFNLSQGLD